MPLWVYLTWTVFENSANIQVGIVALLAIALNNGRAEIGHVWFTPAVQKTKVNFVRGRNRDTDWFAMTDNIMSGKRLIIKTAGGRGQGAGGKRVLRITN
ncbi:MULTISPECIES: hypothetical protein [Nostoc]|uniref:Uncharacterized protein n=2 Tax=Nostoc TaxID=1177 RepID=A0ABR8IDJ0_9NOSO|nr:MULTISPECIES: hypothetical protein [Nostoc]MBD2562017.1 hypothetical protein [Nostoc linckia FACHB-391]MBD2648610.1 hypothetical protein [Nostoc foliaceum FACHB-393]